MKDSPHMPAVVTSRRDVTTDLWIVCIRPEEKISFRAGQYVTIGLPATPRMIERPYSVASSPVEPELEFFLERVPGGQLSPQLYDVPVGGEVFMRRTAKGRFVFDDQSGHKNHFMVATVTGVAPFLSTLRQMAWRAGQGEPIPYRIVLIHAASVSDELGYGEELVTCMREQPWFEYVPTISRPWLDPGWKGERGRAEDTARKYLDAFGFTSEDTTAYICGNPHMIDHVKGILHRVGFSKSSVKEELYWVAEK